MDLVIAPIDTYIENLFLFFSDSEQSKWFYNLVYLFFSLSNFLTRRCRVYRNLGVENFFDRDLVIESLQF